MTARALVVAAPASQGGSHANAAGSTDMLAAAALANARVSAPPQSVPGALW